jgi:hypothetical protein
MQPKNERWWAWVFPIMAGLGIMFSLQGTRGMPLVLAFSVACLVVGSIGTLLLFEFKNTSLRCGKCDEPAPSFQLPASGKQAARGGWTCRKCGAELDRRGQPVED